MKKKIGILTWHYYPNFGSALQAFALQKTIADMGFDVRIVDYENPKYGKATPLVRIKRHILRLKYRMLPKRVGVGLVPASSGPLAFRTKYLRETPLVQNESGVSKLCKSFDIIVFGSDQIWAPNVFNPIYMGATIGADASCVGTGTSAPRLVSYAASIGLDYIPERLVSQYKNYLGRFSAISVRERKGKELLRQVCNISSEVVLDPTLLIDSTVYDGMAKPVERIKSGEYVFCYFLKTDHSYRKKVVQFAQRHGFMIVGVSAVAADREWMQLFQNLGADEFLWLLENAVTVFTDSYHGTIFSLLFHKNFWVFPRFHSDDPICQNSRIEQLNDYFGIASHIVKEEEEIAAAPFDYSGFEERLHELRTASLSFLKKSLE